MNTPNEYVKAFGELIMRIRKERNMSQEELGTLSETSQMTIQRIETGTGGTRLETLLYVAKGLDLGLIDLLKEVEGRTANKIKETNTKWDKVLKKAEKLSKKKKDWLADIINLVLEG